MNITQLIKMIDDHNQLRADRGYKPHSYTRNDIAGMAHVSNTTASYWLEKAVRLGLLSKEKSRPANCYSWWCYERVGRGEPVKGMSEAAQARVP